MVLLIKLLLLIVLLRSIASLNTQLEDCKLLNLKEAQEVKTQFA